MGLPVIRAADKDMAQKADEVALQLGHKFVEGCLAGVPGGGFCMPQANGKPPNPAPKAPQPQPPPAFTPPVQQTPLLTPGGPGYVPHLPNTVPTVENVEDIDPKS